METSIDTSQLETALKLSLGSLTLERVLYTLILLAVCLLVTRLVSSLAKRLLARGDLEERVRKYILGAVRAVLYVLTVLIVADSLGIPVTSLIALFSVFGLAISLAAQDVLSNVAGGLVILFSRPFTLGDYVATDDGEGTVSEISLTHTKLDTYDGLRVMLPNSKLVDGKIINYTPPGGFAGWTTAFPPPTTTAPRRCGPPACGRWSGRRGCCRTPRPRWCSPSMGRAPSHTASGSGQRRRTTGTPTTAPWRRFAAALPRTA